MHAVQVLSPIKVSLPLESVHLTESLDSEPSTCVQVRAAEPPQHGLDSPRNLRDIIPGLRPAPTKVQFVGVTVLALNVLATVCEGRGPFTRQFVEGAMEVGFEPLLFRDDRDLSGGD